MPGSREMTFHEGVGGSQGGYLAGVDGDWRIAGAMGVYRDQS